MAIGCRSLVDGVKFSGVRIKFYTEQVAVWPNTCPNIPPLCPADPGRDSLTPRGENSENFGKNQINNQLIGVLFRQEDRGVEKVTWSTNWVWNASRSH